MRRLRSPAVLGVLALVLLSATFGTLGCSTDADPDATDTSSATDAPAVDVTPDSVTPDGGTPDTTRPDGGLPDTDRPDSDRPDSDRPDSDRPDTDRPDTDRPDSGPTDAGCDGDGACAADHHCDAGACVPDVCEQGAAFCSADGDAFDCDARGATSTLAEACGSNPCEAGACVQVVAAIVVQPLGADVIAQGQNVSFLAVAYDADGAEVPDAVISWESSKTSWLEIDAATGVATGVAKGGGDTLSPDGSLTVTASAGDVSDSVDVQVVRLDTGNGIDVVATELGDESNPNPDGRAHYDGLYPVDIDPPVNTCSPYDAGTTCEWHRGDARLFVGRALQLTLRFKGDAGNFKSGWLELPMDAATNTPAIPRRVLANWSSSDPSVATVVEGYVTALTPGVTSLSAVVGTQTARIDLVVYDRRGYYPDQGFAPGVTPETGHLLAFSSTAGTHTQGTHDTVRYVDLQTYENLDFRPSKYGPQGVRLVETLNDVPERHPGFGCGMARGADDDVWLFNGWNSVLFDAATASQVGGLNKVAWRPDGVFGPMAAQQVCRGVHVELDGHAFLIGFDDKPYTYAAFWSDVGGLEAGHAEAFGIEGEPFTATSSSPAALWGPVVFEQGGKTWLVFVKQTPLGADKVDIPNELWFAELTVDGDGALVVTPDPTKTLQTAPTPKLDHNIGNAPALAVVDVAGQPFILVGNADTVTVVDGTTLQIVSYGGAGDVLERDLDTRRFGQNVKVFAPSPDGSVIYFAPETPQPEATDYFNVTVDFTNWQGTTTSTEMTVHRVGVIDLSDTDGSGLPRLMVDDGDPSECFRDTECLPEEVQYGYDLNLVYLKKWMLDSGLSNSTGAIAPPQAMNVRQLVAGDNALFVIGRDYFDGAGTALGNMSDIAVIDLVSGRMPVFRGWRSIPNQLKGLSDPFGFRLGEDDAVLGAARVKNAGLMWRSGAPPEQNAGDGAPHPDDKEPAKTDNYANAPDVAAETGRLLLLSSSHQAQVDGTMDVIRELHLDGTDWPETDFDPAVDGAQGKTLMYTDTSTYWDAGCGVIAGPGDWVFLLNGESALLFNTITMAQGARIDFSAGAKVCTGVWKDMGGTTWFYGVNMDLKPGDEVLFSAAVPDLASGVVAGSAVVAPVDASGLTFFEPYPDAPDPYDVRYVGAAIHEDELLFLEPNDPWNGFRNTVHRATIGADGALSFDVRPDPANYGYVPGGARDVVGYYTSSGDPSLFVAPFGSGTPALFIGNEGSISVYDLSDPTAPTRLNYNTDGDPLQDDLDTAWFGRGIQGFALSPDGNTLYALPYQKSALLPKAQFQFPLAAGGWRNQDADRYRMVVIDLHAGDKPDLDWSFNNGNGVDLNYYWFKRWIAATGDSALPATFPFFRRQFAASSKSLFLLGNDHPDGMGSALANIGDLATYDLEAARGHLWRGYEYQGLSNASGLWGYDLGVDPASGLDDENLQGARAKNAGVIVVP